jgi:hypothetical protein
MLLLRTEKLPEVPDWLYERKFLGKFRSALLQASVASITLDRGPRSGITQPENVIGLPSLSMMSLYSPSDASKKFAGRT